MKKILLAIDAGNLNQKGLDFSCYLAQLTGSPLCGIFLENLSQQMVPGVRSAYGGVYVETIDTAEVAPFRKKATEDAIGLFNQTCDTRMVAHAIELDQQSPADALVTRSRFADILILEPALFASNELEKPSAFVKDVLSRSECPVIISPCDFEEVSEIIFACDGHESSMFSMRQFTYLFPELNAKKLTVMQAGDQTGDHLPEKEKLNQYLQKHYHHIVFDELAGKPEEELFHRLLRKKNAFVVMGAYGRSKISNFLKHSTADLLIEVNGLPIFIAHR